MNNNRLTNKAKLLIKIGDIYHVVGSFKLNEKHLKKYFKFITGKEAYLKDMVRLSFYKDGNTLGGKKKRHFNSYLAGSSNKHIITYLDPEFISSEKLDTETIYRNRNTAIIYFPDGKVYDSDEACEYVNNNHVADKTMAYYHTLNHSIRPIGHPMFSFKSSDILPGDIDGDTMYLHLTKRNNLQVTKFPVNTRLPLHYGLVIGEVKVSLKKLKVIEKTETYRNKIPCVENE